MNNESNLRSAFTKGMKSMRLLAQPIESGTTGLGVPDEYIRTSRVSAWIEFKFCRYGIRYPFEVPFRPGQATWLERNYQLGGTSILIVGTPDYAYAFVNTKIKRVYDIDLIDVCSWCSVLAGNSFPARAFVKWLDNSLR